MAAAKKPAAKAAPKQAPAKPRAAKDASDPTVELTLAAEEAERGVQAIIEIAATSGWEPVHAEHAAELAKTAADARKKLGQEPAGHVVRFLA